MADAFAGAESQVNQDKMSALTAVAQFGRAGLEQAALNKQRAAQAGTSLATANATAPWASTLRTGYAESRRNLNQAQTDALAAIGADATQAYNQDATDAQSFIKGEQGVAGKVNANYYGQVGQAIPGMRTSAAAQADQYRAAYEQRQADFAAAQQAQELMRQEAALRMQALQQDADIQRQMFLASPEGKAIAAALAAAGGKTLTGMAGRAGKDGQPRYRRG